MHKPEFEAALFSHQTIFDHLPVAIFIVDKRAFIHYSNHHAYDIFLEHFSKPNNLSLSSSTFTEQDLLSAINKVLNHPEGSFSNFITCDHCKQPGLYQLKIVIYPENRMSDNGNQHSQHFLLITLDFIEQNERKKTTQKETDDEISQITLLKKNFKELKQFSRTSAMREVSSYMADKLNQPLTAILSYTQAMQRLYHSHAATEEISEAMARVVANAENAGQIIRNIRSQLNANTLICQNANINQLIQQSIQLTDLDNKSSSIKLITDFEPLSTLLCVDTTQFKQLILSVLNNAIDALLDSQIINPEVFLSTHLKETSYEIIIIDNGPGFPIEVQNRLFEPFFSTKKNAIGIGLSICHHIIELHKGNINITSVSRISEKSESNKHSDHKTVDEKKTGTRVTIRLPKTGFTI